MLSEVKHIRKDLKSLFQISGHMKIPPGLHRHLYDTFQCHICRSSPITPPVIFARCCKRLLGCQTCVDSWYQGEEGMARSCPLCRSERAYADTTPIKGMDEFLRAIVPLLGCNDNTGHGDPSDDDDGMPAITLHGQWLVPATNCFITYLRNYSNNNSYSGYTILLMFCFITLFSDYLWL